jgi:hypothetical protein
MKITDKINTDYGRSFIKAKNLYQAHPMKCMSPANASRTSSNWRGQMSKQSATRLSLEGPLSIITANASKNEQAGPMGSFVRKSSLFDSNKQEYKRQSTETGNQMELSQPITRIHDKNEEKKKELLNKYSKENLIRSVKQSKSKAKHFNSTNQVTFLSKVRNFN